MRIEPSLAPDAQALVATIEAGVPAECVAAQDREAHASPHEAHEVRLLSGVVVLGMAGEDHEGRPAPGCAPPSDITIRRDDTG